MRWMPMPAALVVAALCSACAYTNPIQPPPTPIDLSSPSALTLSANAGTVMARVQNVNGAPLANMAVVFTTTVGSLSPVIARTGADGRAVTTLTATDTATVTATSGSLSTHSLVAPQGPGSGGGTPPSSTPTPAAAFLNVSPSGTTGSALTFSVSSSASGPWSWSFGDGVNTQTSTFTTTHAYGRPGVYVASVSGSGTSAGNAIITVTDPTGSPQTPATALTAALTCQTATAHTQSCNVSSLAYGSTPLASSAITGMTWDWGDGTTTATFPTGSQTYAQAGSYTVLATISANTSDGIRTATATKSVIVP